MQIGILKHSDFEIDLIFRASFGIWPEVCMSAELSPWMCQNGPVQHLMHSPCKVMWRGGSMAGQKNTLIILSVT